MFITQRHTPRILVNRVFKKVGKSEEEIVVQGKGLNTGFSTEVQ